MKTLLALLAAVAVALAALLALVWTDDEPADPARAAAVPDVAPALPALPAAVAAVEAKPVAARRARAKPAASDDDDSTADDEDAEPAVVSFHVVSADDDSPVAGAEIRCQGAATTTDARGGATLGLRPVFAIDAVVRARGFATTHSIQRWAGDRPELTVELDPGVVVPVEVTDAATGRAVAGAEVVFAAPDRTDIVATDAAGRGEALLAPSVDWLVTATAAGHLASADVVRTAAVGAPQPSARFALAAAGTVRGVVRDPDGNPVARAQVTVRHMDRDGHEPSALTDDDGAYAVDGLAFGTRLAVSADGDLENGAHGDSAETTGLVPTSSRPVVTADLRLRRRGTLTLTAFDGDEPIVSGLNVAVSDGTGMRDTVRRGSLEKLELPAGRFEVTVWTDARVPVTESVDIPEGGHVTREIRLSAGDEVAGVVVDDAGEPVYDARVALAAAPAADGMRRPSARTDAEGRFTLTTLPRGGHDARVDPPWEYEPIESCRISAPSQDVRIAVRRRGTVSVRVVFEDDAPPASDARLAFQGVENGEPWRMDRLLPRDGRFQVAWPPARAGAVAISVEGFAPVLRDVNVPLGGSVDLGEIRLRAGVTLTGVLRDAQGRPFSGATLVARLGAGQVRSRTEGDGRFSFHGLPAGTVRIDAATTPFASFRVEVPRAAPALLVVPKGGTLSVLVTDAAGSPAPGRLVQARDADGEIVAEDATESDGIASLRLVPGRYAVSADGGARSEVEVREGETALLRLR